ncbi:hypothetical protein P691DRAFT_696412 [Macrolepiota fuliginosa MF-IS2]|uniref:CRAL-TRIO domain-containing protein n=1 Tax=Macrolepiota fuliginosa MF-IS2 TaxID=1400762 RepID=A0A9P5XKW6_9AGAR|nr:hypothetical protein P691DRAFT_696412 [Macrolepiota fuliginosa MF-IS2]
MDIQELLKSNSKQLLKEYNENMDHVLDLQTTLIRDILPSVVDEFELGPDATEWAEEWLNDTASIFRIARRNKFTRSFALESIRKNLVWRLQNLWPTNAGFVSPAAVHCLPEHVRDPFGRPILIVEVVPVNESPEVVKPYIIQAFELLRLHLKSLSGAGAPEEEPVLQYIILLDLAKLSIQSLNIDVMTWTIREVIPRFPGMLAGVFMTNYSWAHSGAWSVVKRILPKTALARVFFPTQEDLLTVMTPAALPKDYGGILPFLTDLGDPLQSGSIQTFPSIAGVTEDGPSSSTSQPTSGYIPSISPTSMLNPFYGYPAASTRGYPQLHHGRRRKRDLARTLVWLFWLRWRTHIAIGVVLTALTLAVNFGLRRGLPRLPRIFLGGRASLLSALRTPSGRQG